MHIVARRAIAHLSGLCAVAVAATLAGAAYADAVSDFYRHHTLTLIAGFPPGPGGAASWCWEAWHSDWLWGRSGSA